MIPDTPTPKQPMPPRITRLVSVHTTGLAPNHRRILRPAIITLIEDIETNASYPGETAYLVTVAAGSLLRIANALHTQGPKP